MQRRDLLKCLGVAGGMGLIHRPASAGVPLLSSSALAASTDDLFEQYGRRFAEARLRMPHRDPARPEDRRAIADTVRACLGIRDAWVPTMRAEVTRTMDFDGGRIEMLRATSWPGTVATALLYGPKFSKAASPDRLPLVVLCCGHGKGGKLSAGYQRMARHIARRGALVLCPDNLGQGEREPMGHSACVKPFACGLSVQGLIVMETLGWIRWASQRPDVDRDRLAAIGNSGGGTLTVFLAALAPELAVLSSSGYPSTFEFVAAKEKKHCHCNLLPGVLGRLEMWHLLGCFAPRPMFLFQGAMDTLFPQDLFYQVARQVRGVYRRQAAEKVFEAKIVPGEHSWDEGRNRSLGEFLARHLHLDRRTPREDADEKLLELDDRCIATWPADALTTDAIAEKLSGQRARDGMELCDVFPPQVPKDATLQDVAPRGSSRQIFAQYEAFLARRGI